MTRPCRHTRLLLSAMLVCCAAQAAAQIHQLREFVVTGSRPMKDIGVERTDFDSTALKENIALSMADILTFNSSVFVKNYGRATLSTVAFRGTSPGHTQVTWNGMRINNPMMGMTDFSTIPAYFIDRATLLHGTSSVNETGGGLGGLVRLGTIPDAPDGFGLQYIQGIGSFSTFDEFLRLTWHDTHWTSSTRAVYSSSPNDYSYINHDRKVNIYDDSHNIIGQYHPREHNRSGAFRDLHLLHELYYTTGRGDRFGLNAWYINSNRELPMLTTDYSDEREFENRQREHTLRTVVSWDHYRDRWKTTLRAGYIHTHMAYDYRREITDGNWADMTRSRSRVNTMYAQADGEYAPSKKWFFNAGVSAHQHFVRSKDRNVILVDGDRAVVGYDCARIELSASASAKWQPITPLGLSVVLRQDMYGNDFAPLIPAFFADWQQPAWTLGDNLVQLGFKASVSRNHRFPTLNDMYFLPGGNPDLRNESGYTWDAGLSLDAGKSGVYSLDFSANWFDSHIDDWIIWLPTTKGFFSPRNVKKVHSYGVELRASLGIQPHRDWLVDLNGSYSWTPSLNCGEPMSPGDKSIGRQLPYVPRHSASVTGRLAWRSWAFLYKWAYYSQRYTMSSNEYTISGYLPPYFMSNITLEKGLRFRPLDIQLKLAVNNLFNEDYLSVLSRPMPGRNYEFFIAITPHF